MQWNTNAFVGTILVVSLIIISIIKPGGAIEEKITSNGKLDARKVYNTLGISMTICLLNGGVILYAGDPRPALLILAIIIIALDISNSMLAQDVQPSRLEKAKRLISRLVDELDNDKIGMIVFAGDAFTQLPITSDYISAKMFLESISPSLISKQGTAIGEAINLAVRSFTPQEGVGRAIVVITDGENHEGGAVEAAKVAAEKGIQVSVLGVGMPDGAPIPIEGTNDYRRDREGNVIVTRLNEAMCQEIAKEGKGIYVRVDNTNSAQKAINQEVNKMAKSDVESKVYTEFNEQFQAIAWIILILLLAELLILDRKNPLFKNVHLFSNKK